MSISSKTYSEIDSDLEASSECERNECDCNECDCNDCDCKEVSSESDDVSSQNDTENEDNDDDENSGIIRGKWLYDGCKTIDEMIERLQLEIENFQFLKNDGWYLVDEVNDDYAFIRRNVENTDTSSS